MVTRLNAYSPIACTVSSASAPSAAALVKGNDVRIGGTRVNRLTPAERNVAMVFQFYALYPTLTVRETLAVVASGVPAEMFAGQNEADALRDAERGVEQCGEIFDPRIESEAGGGYDHQAAIEHLHGCFPSIKPKARPR